jgi:hypothetical protein
VWTLFLLVTTEILVTYSRLPAAELYHVSGTGLQGGASRALVFLDFPLALVAIAILALLYPRLRTRGAKVLSAAGIALCSVIFWPGVVKESDLDARPINALPAFGVLAALAITIAAGRLERPAAAPRQRWDRFRVAVAVLTLVLAVPWLAADLGLSFEGVPILGSIYQTGELRAQPHVSELHPAVHHGHHHGMDGVLLVLSALVLSRLLAGLESGRLRLALGAYLALMLSYGAGNLANDFWLEQVVKRGWADWEIPGVITPRPSVAWGVIVAAAAVAWGIGVLSAQRAPARPSETKTA